MLFSNKPELGEGAGRQRGTGWVWDVVPPAVNRLIRDQLRISVQCLQVSQSLSECRGLGLGGRTGGVDWWVLGPGELSPASQLGWSPELFSLLPGAMLEAKNEPSESRRHPPTIKILWLEVLLGLNVNRNSH